MTMQEATPAAGGDQAPTGRVVVLGSLNTDIFARVERHPLPGETLIGAGGQTRAGGKGANQAAAAALSGASVVMIGAVGSDAHARTALEGLTRAGADLSGVRVVDGPTGIALITVSADGENSIIVIPGANGEVGEPELARIADLDAADVLVLQGEVPVTVAAAAARQAASLGARVMVNLAPVVPYPADVLQLADPLVVNEHEGAGALALLSPGAPVPSSPSSLVQALLDVGVRSVVMTLGSAGALVAAPSITTVPAVTVEAVDTTGAGDAFAGVLAGGLVAGLSMPDAATAANRFAAEAVQHEGAQDSYPDWRTR